MHTLSLYAPRIIQALGWSLLHSLWQGAVLYSLLLALFRAFPAMSARLKYSCALTALFGLLLWMANTGIGQWQALDAVAIRVTPGNDASAAYLIGVPPAGAGFAGMARLAALMPWLVFAYAAGLLAMLLRLGGGLARIHRLRTQGTLPPDAAISATLQSLKLQIGIAQKVALRLSARVAVPLVIGAFRPLILIPASMLEELGPEGLEAVLLHELAHISRDDFFINLLQSVIETALFFNPFVWRLSAIIRREREHCCDDIVVAHTRQPLTYAHALAALAQQGSGTAPVAALAATGHQQPSHLLNRIKRIIEMKNIPVRHSRIIAACTLAAILITCSIVWLTPAFAQRSKRGDAKPAQQSIGNYSSHSNIRITDSNGVLHEYSDMDQIPAKDRAALQKQLSALGDTLAGQQRLSALADMDLPEALMDTAALSREIQQAFKFLPTLAQIFPKTAAAAMPAVRAGVGKAMKEAQTALAGVDWQAISREVDSAVQQVADIDWAGIDRQVAAGMETAQQALADAGAASRREMADARRDAARDRRQAMAERRRDLEQARRDMEQARQDMEQARHDLERARRDMERDATDRKRRREE